MTLWPGVGWTMKVFDVSSAGCVFIPLCLMLVIMKISSDFPCKIPFIDPEHSQVQSTI